MRLQTQTQIASTAAKVDAQRAALRTAALNLEYATIHAPISGLIGDTLVPVGGLVNANSQQPLTTIVPLDPIWVRFKVTESQYLAFKKNPEPLRAPLTLILADNTEFPEKGRIENTLNQVDPKTGTLEMQASFPNPRHTLLPGQFGKLRVRNRSAQERCADAATGGSAVTKHANRVYAARLQTRWNCVRSPPPSAWAKTGSSLKD